MINNCYTYFIRSCIALLSRRVSWSSFPPLILVLNVTFAKYFCLVSMPLHVSPVVYRLKLHLKSLFRLPRKPSPRDQMLSAEHAETCEQPWRYGTAVREPPLQHSRPTRDDHHPCNNDNHRHTDVRYQHVCRELRNDRVHIARILQAGSTVGWRNSYQRLIAKSAFEIGSKKGFSN
ncbi:hypothetical protein BD410DRAFT_375443 [Rickenella mellea]|uniref:Uncharacterized protein n=1 Tax=Rickenella mellea TaxID=50990 RepID=A0A4Y7PZ47_9AGAM|nr:hypothetical protein BD410DRAFT_375443 [Rickenella mellea]